ncbi:MAG: serine/threonine-protein kinase [Candidatus Micrarchaeota archaeon]
MTDRLKTKDRIKDRVDKILQDAKRSATPARGVTAMVPFGTRDQSLSSPVSGLEIEVTHVADMVREPEGCSLGKVTIGIEGGQRTYNLLKILTSSASLRETPDKPITYLAECLETGEKVVVKKAPMTFQNLKLEERGYKVLKEIDNPHVVKVLIDDAKEGFYYQVMQLVSGNNLRQFLETDQLTLNQVIGLAKQISKGLTAVHDVGAVHRDIHPGNVMIYLEDGKLHVVIVDFGLSYKTNGSTHHSTVMRAPFTPNYTAPELLEMGEATVRSDVYSFGAVLSWIFTGIEGSLIKKKIADKEEINFRVNCTYAQKERILLIIQKALHSDASRRYESSEEILLDLNNLKPSVTNSSEVPIIKTKRRSFFSEVVRGTAALLLVFAGVNFLDKVTPPDFIRRTGEVVASKIDNLANTEENKKMTDDERQEILLEAIVAGDIKKLRQNLAFIQDINQPLLHADYGSKLMIPISLFDYALTGAPIEKRLEILEILLAHGANPDLKDSFHTNILTLFRKQIEVLRSQEGNLKTSQEIKYIKAIIVFLKKYGAKE